MGFPAVCNAPTIIEPNLTFHFWLENSNTENNRLKSRPYNLHRSCPSANCLPHWSKVDIFRAGARRADIWQFSKTELSQRRLWNSGEITTNLHPALGCTCPICSWFVNPLTVKSSFVWILSLLLSAWVQKWNSISKRDDALCSSTSMLYEPLAPKNI